MQEIKMKDLYLSAFLCAEEMVLKRIERENGICWFVFEKTNQSDGLVDKFWSGEAICNVKAFTNAIRTLKDRIFSER